ncbi:MAG: hypothetical protein M5U11_15475 [Anaerolineales bacterium]|nr:hypothetical protein [Anaerolineales bacterium]
MNEVFDGRFPEIGPGSEHEEEGEEDVSEEGARQVPGSRFRVGDGPLFDDGVNDDEESRQRGEDADGGGDSQKERGDDHAERSAFSAFGFVVERVRHFESEERRSREEDEERHVFGVDEGVTEQERLCGKERRRAEGRPFTHPAQAETIDEIDAEQEGQEVDQPPGGDFLQAERFEQVDGRPRQQEVGGAAVLVIVPAGAVGFGEVEIGGEPIGGSIRVSQRLAVLVKKRLVPREAVIAEGGQPEDELGEEEQNEGSMFIDGTRGLGHRA